MYFYISKTTIRDRSPVAFGIGKYSNAFEMAQKMANNIYRRMKFSFTSDLGKITLNPSNFLFVILVFFFLFFNIDYFAICVVYIYPNFYESISDLNMLNSFNRIRLWYQNTCNVIAFTLFDRQIREDSYLDLLIDIRIMAPRSNSSFSQSSTFEIIH